MNFMSQFILTIISSVLTSGGLWTYIQRKTEQNDNKKEMLIGLGHDRIVSLGMTYIERGYITQDEYENLNDYLYIPYRKMGGNGSAQRIMEEVNKLPIRNFKIGG